MGIPLHSGGYVTAHLGGTGNSKRTLACFEDYTNIITTVAFV